MKDSVFEVGQLIELPQEIRFNFCRSFFNRYMTEESYAVLSELAVFLKAHPQLRVEVGNYTDSRGSTEANKTFSTSRSKEIRKDLIAQGADSTQISYSGYGETDPITVYLVEGKYYNYDPLMENYELLTLTEEYINQFKKSDPGVFEMLHQYNRRLEIKIVEILD